MENAIISVQKVNKSFSVSGQQIPVLKNISLEVRNGDFLVIFGPSGCGKSTLLHAILGLEQPTSGRVYFLGKEIYDSMSEDGRSDFRKHNVGMVYQQPNWIRSMTVRENVAFPLQLLGWDKAVAFNKALTALSSTGMQNWADYIPTELSSGQQQRVALARALIIEPEIIITDEPTGNLDYESGQDVMALLQHYNQINHKTILTVTHDLEYLKYATTAVKMFNGEIVGQYQDREKEKMQLELKGKRGGQ